MVFNSTAVLFTMINDGDLLTTAPVGFRGDFTGPQLRMAAEQSKDAAFSRRLLALAEIYDAGSRSDAARNGGVGLQTIRDWVRRSNTWGPDGLEGLQGIGPALKTQGRAQACPHSDGRARAKPSHARGSSLAADQPSSTRVTGHMGSNQFID